MESRVEALSSEFENLRTHLSSQQAELSSLREDDDLKETNESADAADSPLASAPLGLNIDESLDPKQLSEQLSHLQNTHSWLLSATRRTELAGTARHKRRATLSPAAGGGFSQSPVNYVSRSAYDEMNARLHAKLSQRDAILHSSLRAQNRLRKLQVRCALFAA